MMKILYDSNYLRWNSWRIIDSQRPKPLNNMQNVNIAQIKSVLYKLFPIQDIMAQAMNSDCICGSLSFFIFIISYESYRKYGTVTEGFLVQPETLNHQPCKCAVFSKQFLLKQDHFLIYIKVAIARQTLSILKIQIEITLLSQFQLLVYACRE